MRMRGLAVPPMFTLSLRDALPISPGDAGQRREQGHGLEAGLCQQAVADPERVEGARGLGRLRHALGDRKSTRLNTSHSQSSYAVLRSQKKRVGNTVRTQGNRSAQL